MPHTISAVKAAAFIEEQQTEDVWETFLLPEEVDTVPSEAETEETVPDEDDSRLIWETDIAAADEPGEEDLIILEAETDESEMTWQEKMALSGISIDPDAMDGMDFSSMRLIVSADDNMLIADQENILSSFADLYLLQYANTADVRTAYAYYAGAAQKGLVHFADTDSPVYAADELTDAGWEEEYTDSVEMDEYDNPLAQLADALSDNTPVRQDRVIALIDTGVSDLSAVVQAVSVIGDDPGDDSGHGTHMQQIILEQYPEAKIMSVKALDGQGQGSVSSVCSAVRYAMEAGADIINLSLYALKTAENSALETLITEAVNSGIQVVGAAGNAGRPVRFYVPGSVPEALIVGACDENGVKISSSNYGDTVDFNVCADSTSEAAAKMSAFVAQYQPVGAADYHANKNKLIFTTDYTAAASEAESEALSEEESEEEQIDDGIFMAALNMDAIPRFKGMLYYTSTDVLISIGTSDYTAGSTPTSTLKRASFVSETEGVTPAFCLVPDKTAAKTQNATNVTIKEVEDITEISKENRTRLLKAMFYLYGGRGYSQGIGGMEDLMEKYGITTSNGKYVLSHYVMSYIYCAGTSNGTWNYSSAGGGQTAFNDDGIAMIKDFVKKLDKLDVPSKVSLSKTSVTAKEVSVNGEVRTTPLVKYTSPVTDNDVTFTIPDNWSDITVVRVDSEGGEKRYGSGKKVTISPGDSFYLMRTGSAVSKTTLTLKPKCYSDFKGYVGYFPSQAIQSIGLSYSTNASLEVSFAWPEADKPTYVYVEKRSAAPQLSAGNRCYSLEGASFKLYREDGSAISQAACDLITGPEQDTGEKTEDGRSIMMAATNLLQILPGTYYAEEIDAPKGYARQTQRIKVTVTKDNTENNPAKIEARNVPKADPFGISIVKISDQGETAHSLEGAEFTIAYYDAGYETEEQIRAAGDRPARTWTVTVKKKTAGGRTTYTADLDESAAGDPFYIDNDGNISLPLGTLVIRETKAPQYYGLDNAQVKAGNAPDDAYGAFPFITQIAEDASGTARIVSRNEVTGEVAEVLEHQILMTSHASGTALDAEFAIPGKSTVIKDIVEMQSLSSSREYILKGRIIDEADSTVIAASQSEPFKGTEGITTAEIIFKEVDLSGYAGKYVLAECELYETADMSRFIAGHTCEDMTEQEKDNQRIYVPEIRTTVRGDETKDQYIRAEAEALLTDTVHYSGLKPGRTYRLTGRVVRKNTAEGETSFVQTDAFMYDPLSGKDAADSQVDYAVFTPQQGSGEVDVHFCLDSSDLSGAQLVVFETLYLEETSDGAEKIIEIAQHEDIHDKGQTLYVSRIRTQASSMNTGDHTAEGYENLVITDRVSYEHLNTEKTYFLRGSVVDRESGEPVEYRMVNEQGEEIDAAVFTPDTESSSGDIEVYFALNGEQYRGRSLVVFETVSEDPEGRIVLASHQDLNDEDQSVRLPEIRTNAKDIKTENDHALAEEDAVLIDTVSYTNLMPGYTYTVKGTLHNRLNGEEIASQMVDEEGNEIEEYAFTVPEDAPRNAGGGVDGEVRIRLRYDASKAAGRSAVVFEKLYHGIEVAAHEDLKDEDQRVYIPKIRTQAEGKDTGKNEAKVSEKTVITDTVSYEGLKIGQSYTLKGTLMDKSSGKPVKAAGKTVTAEKVFTAEKEKGEVKLTFTFDSTSLESRTLVVFEDLYLKDTDKKVAVHNDLKDKAQSVTLIQENPESESRPKNKSEGSAGGSTGSVKTGDDQPVPLFVLLSALSLAVVLWVVRRRLHRAA